MLLYILSKSLGPEQRGGGSAHVTLLFCLARKKNSGVVSRCPSALAQLGIISKPYNFLVTLSFKIHLQEDDVYGSVWDGNHMG